MPFVAATGEEKWAVVPQAVTGNLYKLADANYKNNHQFFVDGSPEVSDVFDGTNWRTILVGGLNAGGKSYYALDVTDPAAPKALWEFRAFPGAQCPSSPGAAVGNTSDCNLGLTFGKPVITKIGSTWVVLVTSGYNNINSATNGGDGGGYLYAINAVTGALVHKIDTGVGAATDPSGLAQIRNFVDDTLVDNTTLRAYGGDLYGNVWRFEFPNPGSPSAQRIGTAKDAANKRQPITTKPEIAENGNAPMVFVGTGKLLGSTDVEDQSVQSIYAIVDPLTPGPVHTDLRGALKPLVMTQTGTGASAVRTIACPTSAGAACNRTTGWVLDLPEAGERVNVDMKLLFGVLVVPSNVPEAASCTVGGHSWFNFFDYKTGTQALGVPVSTYFGETLIAGFNVFKMPAPDNQQGFRIVGVGTDGRRQSTPPIYPPPVPSGKRIAWREIVQ
jgi:type IV pilus assembly protein PilY1